MLKKYEQIPQAFSNYLSVELDKLLEWTHVVPKKMVMFPVLPLNHAFGVQHDAFDSSLNHSFGTTYL